jgi:hypothetical protein
VHVQLLKSACGGPLAGESPATEAQRRYAVPDALTHLDILTMREVKWARYWSQVQVAASD